MSNMEAKKNVSSIKITSTYSEFENEMIENSFSPQLFSKHNYYNTPKQIQRNCLRNTLEHTIKTRNSIYPIYFDYISPHNYFRRSWKFFQAPAQHEPTQTWKNLKKPRIQHTQHVYNNLIHPTTTNTRTTTITFRIITVFARTFQS